MIRWIFYILKHMNGARLFIQPEVTPAVTSSM